MTTINNTSDLVRILREHPDWAVTLRSILLTEDLLDLPHRFDEFVQSTEGRFHQLETGQSGLMESVGAFNGRIDSLGDRLGTSFNALNGRMDNGFGAAYELKVERNIHSLAGKHVDLRGVQVLRGALLPMDGRLREACEQAEVNGQITAQLLTELWAADLILSGWDRRTSLTVHAVMEASITVGDNDIIRASDRRETLAEVSGNTVIAAVVGAHIDQTRRDLAIARGVRVIQMPEDY